MIPISKVAAEVKPSATLAAGAKAKQMKADGIHVYDFSLGEPDFPTPEHICQAATEAMKQGHTHYTPAAGTMELRRTIADWYQKTYGLPCGAENVLVSNGAKHSIHNALFATVGPGDEVIIPSPYWVSYSDLVQMTGARYVLIPATHETGFKISPEQLRQALTPKTRLVMLNSPSNPTGAVYSRQELQALADVILDSRAAVLSDEIYERLVYGDEQATCFATLRPELTERTITISGVSKTYAMTGWRIGWAGRSSSGDQSDGDSAKPANGMSVERGSTGDDRGAYGGSVVCRRNASGICLSTRSRMRASVGDAWDHLRETRRRVLRIFQRRQPFRSNPGRKNNPRFCRFLRSSPGIGTRQSRTGVGFRERGLRAPVVRYESRRTDWRPRPTGKADFVTRMTSNHGCSVPEGR
ncbi:MAG: hypothetical protein KatS3mg105_3804 [Gemmatales bacterium]|nr:MAG: hypothetical protein KatS3mg105_3804 [Gemmatales bacterium]